MGNTNSSARVSARDRAILDLKLQRDRVQIYQKKIQDTSARETEIARKCLRRGDKPKALLALRRKKYQQSILSRTDEQLAELERLVAEVEFSLVQKDVLFGIQQGTAAMRDIHREIGGLEKVEKLLEDNEESIQYQKELNQLLQSRMVHADEDEVEIELDAMEAELLSSNLPIPASRPVRAQPAKEAPPAVVPVLQERLSTDGSAVSGLQEGPQLVPA